MTTQFSSRLRPDIKVILADDHNMVRHGLQRILECEPGVRVTGQATDGTETLIRVNAVACDVLLMDLNMPAPSGPDLIRRVLELKPGLPILVVSMHNQAAVVRATLEAGASGYLTKDCEPEMLLLAVRRLAEGGRYVDSRLMESLVFSPKAPPGGEDNLTPREKQVLKLLANGQSNAQIARALYISEKTISTHKMNIKVKLGLQTTADLIRYADKNLGVNEGFN